MRATDEADFDLVVLGDCNADLVVRADDVVPAFGQQERLVDEAKLTIGGSGGICASGAAKLGLRVAMVGVVGDDTFGRFMRDSLAERGVDVSAVHIEPRVPTGLTVHLVQHDDRAMLTLPGTISRLRPALVDRTLIAASRHLHVSSYFLQSALWAGLQAILQEARAAGLTTSVDPNWDPSGEWDSGLSGILSDLDVVLPNDAEAVNLARALAADVEAHAANGPRPPEDAGDRQESTPAHAALRLAAAGPTVVVKTGSRGALAAVPGHGLARVPALPGVEPKDTVGAGDSFDAGYLASMLWGYDTERALALGAACGALSTRLTGGTDAQPTLAEAEAAAERLLASL